jgi:hypothetical protein
MYVAFPKGVRMPFLRELKLNNCDDINISSMAALSQCVTLEVNISRIFIFEDFCITIKEDNPQIIFLNLNMILDSDDDIGFMCPLDGC